MARGRRDQFSFAVSLHRALEGVAPFDGRDGAELASRIRSGEIATARDGRIVPAWLRAIVGRGLAADPEARFPSMFALLAELARPRGWRRWRMPLAVGALGALGALVALAVIPGAQDPLASCDGGEAQAGAVWNDTKRAHFRARLTAVVTTPDAADIHARVLRGVEDYRVHWSAMHREACVANRKGEQSDTLLDLRMRCLSKRLGDFGATVKVLEQLEAASAGKAVDIIARTPRVADCADLERLQAETPPPPPAQRAAVDDVRRQISNAMALDRAGQSMAALAAATRAVTDAERSGYSPIIADAALTQGRIRLARHEVEPALRSLARARTVAFEQGQFAVAIEAAARALYLQGGDDADVAAMERQTDVLVPLSKWLQVDHFAGPLLLNNIGTVYMAAGDRKQATQYFHAAHAAIEGLAAPDLELSNIAMNLAMVTSDGETRERLARSSWERDRAELGESHPARRTVYLITPADQPMNSLCTSLPPEAAPGKPTPILISQPTASGQLSDVDVGELASYALIIPGAIYDAKARLIMRSVAPATSQLRGSSHRWFNLACADDALAQTELSGLATAPITDSASASARLPALHMFTAKYCDGISATTRGMPISWRLNGPSLLRGLNRDGRGPLEAMWGPDGALCVEHSRLWMSNKTISLPFQLIDLPAFQDPNRPITFPVDEGDFLSRLCPGRIKKCEGLDAPNTLVSYTVNHIDE